MWFVKVESKDYKVVDITMNTKVEADTKVVELVVFVMA